MDSQHWFLSLVKVEVGGTIGSGSSPDPAIFVIDLQDANKKLIFLKSLSAYYFLNVHLHHFSKIESLKEVTKQYKSRYFLLFLLDDRRIRIRILDPYL
jgi:hypothetical protein